MTTNNKKLLDLALKAYENKELDRADRFAFARDHKRFANQELTFRELLEAIRTPTGELKEAMKEHYAQTVYNRTFK
jgi:hypothetical protein